MDTAYPAVEIFWRDSNRMTGWFHEHEVEEFADADDVITCRTVGLLVTERPDRIVVAIAEHTQGVLNPVAIPRSAIINIQYLETCSKCGRGETHICRDDPAGVSVA